MKKILLICMISITTFSGTFFKIGVGYTDYTTPSRINKDGTPSLEISKRALNIKVPIEVGYEYIYFKNNFGIIGAIGTELSLGYGKLPKEEAKNDYQKFIPGYLGTYAQLNFAYRLSSNTNMRIGAKAGIGANLFYFFEEKSKIDTKIPQIISPGYEIPFGGVVGFQISSFLIELEVGAKYMFANADKEIGYILDVLSMGSIKTNFMNTEKNPLSYNLEAESITAKPYYKDKIVFNTGLKIGFAF